MKISYNWLKSYLNFNESPEELSEILTDTGLEVEKLEKFDTHPGGLEGVVVGEVMEVTDHPNADKLKVTIVDVAAGDDLKIVCGAPNVAKGQKVLVATVGTTLMPEPDKPFKIKKAKIRGEESYGMICAEDELGLSNNHDGIMVLPTDAEVGIPAAEYLNLESDYIFEIGLTPNRTDAFGHFGVARDIAARLSLKTPVKAELPSVSELPSGSGKPPVSVEIIDKDGCGRYAGLTIQNVQVGPSPDWLQSKLRAIGLNPTNNVVDITNFVLHETGQPLHAFDADQIIGNKVIVKSMKQGSKFTTLDGVERELHSDDLMICNEKEGMCIAGVFGGEKSGVKNDTQNIFLESAWFNPVRIRKTAKRHALNTDASFRFERGVDPKGALYALKRAAMLIIEIAGGEIEGDIIDEVGELPQSPQVNLNLNDLKMLTGLSIHTQEVKSILNSLDIEVLQEDEETLELKIPTYRVDVTRQADVIEEILRIKGYNSVEMPNRMSLSVSIEEKPERSEIIQSISNVLAGRGFNETMSNGLTRSDRIIKVKPEMEGLLVKMLNPLSQELDVLRPDLLVTSLDNVAYNLNRQSERLRMFEIGKAYRVNNSEYAESTRLAMIMTGTRLTENWSNSVANVNLSDLNGELKAVFQSMGLNYSLKESEEKNEFFSTFIDISLRKTPIGQLGVISDRAAKIYGIKQSVLYLEINLDECVKRINHADRKMEELPKFPSVRRDLSLLIDREVSFTEIEKIARSKANKYLKNIGLFDVYEGKNLPDGKKSYAVSFTIGDEKKTLEEKQIEKIIDSIQKELESKLGASLR